MRLLATHGQKKSATPLFDTFHAIIIFTILIGGFVKSSAFGEQPAIVPNMPACNLFKYTMADIAPIWLLCFLPQKVILPLYPASLRMGGATDLMDF